MSFSYVVTIEYEESNPLSLIWLGKILANEENEYIIQDIAFIDYQTRGEKLTLTFWEHDQESPSQEGFSFAQRYYA